jgi:hypothetical protein
MQSELQFVRERFAIVKERREKIDTLMIEAAHEVDRWEMITVRREYRLLGKILAEVTEGRVLKALQQWREIHCQKLQAHKLRTRAAQNAADEYWRLPAIEREAAGKPPKNPSIGIKFKDTHGEVWVIDDHYIMMMDRMIEQLQRWLVFEE